MNVCWMQWNKEKLNLKYEKLIVAIEIILCTLVMLSVCFNNNIWWDEAYTYDIVLNNSMAEMIKTTALDVHPPLYYLILQVITGVFGDGLFVFKCVSILAAVFSMILGGTVIRKRWGIKTSVLFIFFAGFAPQMLFFNVQLRMYSWAAFFLLASAVYAYEIICENRIKDWVLFVFFSLCGAYTLYFAAVTCAIMYAFLLVYFMLRDRTQIKKWLIACGATIALYLPWLYLFLVFTTSMFPEEAVSDTVIEKGQFSEFILWAFESDIEADWIIYAGVCIVALLMLWKKKKEFAHGKGIYLITLVATPVWTWLFGSVCTYMANKPVLHRYIFPSLMLFWLAIAILLGRFRNRVFYVVMMMVCILGMYNYKFVYFDEYHIAPRLEMTEQFIENNMSEDELVVYELEPFRIMYEYYMPGQNLVYLEDLNLKEQIGKSFWYIDAWGDYFSQEEIETYHIVKEEYGDFGIQSMDFKIYKITVNGNE